MTILYWQIKGHRLHRVFLSLFIYQGPKFTCSCINNTILDIHTNNPIHSEDQVIRAAKAKLMVVELSKTFYITVDNETAFNSENTVILAININRSYLCGFVGMDSNGFRRYSGSTVSIQ